jgi:outer membrane protein assembly factor BamB
MKTARQLLLLTATVGLCGEWAAAIANKDRILPPQPEPLISHTLIQEAGWDYNWQINIPLKASEQVSRMHVLGQNVVVLTNLNMLFCIDQKTGRTRSLLQISRAGLPTSHPSFYENKVSFIVGNEVQVFDPSSGTITFRRKFPQIGNSQGALARNSKHLFIAGSDNRLHAINLDGYWQQFEASADNDSPIVSAAATEEIVVFATQAGNVIGMDAASPRKLWQFDATGPIQAPLEPDDHAIYVGSEDSKVYKLRLSNGTLWWAEPFHSGGPIMAPMTVGRRLLYVYNNLSGLYGIDKETGKAVWTLANGRSMICESDDKAFLYADNGILKVMDNTSGKELYSMNFASVTRTAQNRFSPVMFLGDQTGRLMSITVK